MKKRILLLSFALLSILSVNAQVLVGDMNGDGELNMSDVTAAINTVLGKTPKRYIDPYKSDTYEYVDLGLPSGTLWATCNVGASTPVGFGYYFAWGERTPQGSNEYSWTSYKWCRGGINTMTKYCTDTSYGTPDDMTELDVTDDAAYVNWGSDWLMPDWLQVSELKDNCTWTWTTQSGVDGYTVTGKNGNSIFLPAVGIYYDSTLNREGSIGGYWSRSLFTNYQNWACGLYFNSEGTLSDGSLGVKIDNGDNEYGSYNERHCGLCVRPVYKDKSGTPADTPTGDNLLAGNFSISAKKQVQFTKGNLYWDGSDFKFEANQTDYPTSWDANHVGHLYWTATAADSYAETNNTVVKGTFTSNEFFIDGSDADHRITVEGTSGLYVLSSGEWEYLFYSRENAQSLRKYGVTVTNGGKTYDNCIILAPDDFTGTLQSSYTLDEVNAAGLLCLPTAGYRDGSTINSDGTGYYWSGTLITFLKAGVYDLYINGDCVEVPYTHEFNRYQGLSTRLVKDAESSSDKEPRKLITAITIEPSSLTVNPGDNATLTVTISPSDAANQNVLWSTTNENVAFFDGSTFTAVAEGTATITCSATDGTGVKGTCIVTVVSK